MARSKKNKKPKDQKASGGRGPAEMAAGASRGSSEILQPTTYSENAMMPPAEDDEATDASTTTLAITDAQLAGNTAVALNEPMAINAFSTILENDAVDVKLPPTPDTRPGNGPGTSDGKALDGHPEWDFSLLKKDEISEAGSPGLLVKDTREKDPSEENRFVEGLADEAKDEATRDATLETTAFKVDTSPDAKAVVQPLGIVGELPFQEAKNTNIGMGSKADWDTAFGPASDGQECEAAAASGDPFVERATASERSGAQQNTEPVNPPSTETIQHDFAQIIIDKEALIHHREVLFQNCYDELQRTKQQRTHLRGERDRFQQELDGAHATLQSLHERRHKLQQEKDKYKLREADRAKEKEWLEAQIEQLIKTGLPAAGGATLRNGTPKLVDELEALRHKLKEAQDELKTLRDYKDAQEGQNVFRARIASCTTENEKLKRFGGTMDRTSPLYRTLKKLADFHDDGGPKPTADEQAQIRTFENTLAERKRVMVQARTHPDPREFMKPYLDRWDRLALASGWGSTLTVRLMATRVALDKHYEEEDVRIYKEKLGIQ